MTDAARQRMTPDAFLLWCLDQEDTYELIDGQPVLKFDNGPELMAGASAAHDQIVVNLISRLRERLRGGSCRVKTADQAARMTRGNIRRPDATVDCGPWRPESYESSAPAVIFEVLSPSTRGFDLLKKTDEYRALAGLRHFLMLESAAVKVLVWSRDDGGDWLVKELSGSRAVIDLNAIGVSLSLSEIYEDVELDPSEAVRL